MEKLSRLERMGGWIAAAGFAVFAAMVAEGALAASITASKHNLGTAGTGSVHLTAGTDEVCVFCHTPHGGQIGSAPLWNKALVVPAGGYQLYGSTGGGESATLDGQVLTVGSVSQACLSCHDGTQAMDNMINAPGSGGYTATGARLSGAVWTGALADGLMPGSGITNIGTDLRNDHPIGVEYCGGGITEAAGTCKDPDFKAVSRATINGLVQFWVDTSGTGTREKADMILYRRTFAAGVSPSVECGSCHDPHNPDNGTFLRIANNTSNLCGACHVK